MFLLNAIVVPDSMLLEFAKEFLSTGLYRSDPGIIFLLNTLLISPEIKNSAPLYLISISQLSFAGSM
jgi:hypothetical protein